MTGAEDGDAGSVLGESGTPAPDEIIRSLRCKKPEQFVATLVELAEHQGLLDLVISQAEVAKNLSKATQELWNRRVRTVHPAESVAAVAASVMANPARMGVTFGHANTVRNLKDLLPPEAWLAFHESVIARIMSTDRYQNISRLGGLFYYLLDAAECAFDARSPDRALEFASAARLIRGQLPETEKSAEARIRGAIRYATYVAYADKSALLQLWSPALDELHEELDCILGYGSPRGRQLRLESALSEANLLNTLDATGVMGTITAAERRIGVLSDALNEGFGVADSDGHPDPELLEVELSESTPSERAALGPISVEIAKSYAITGDVGRAKWWVKHSGTYDLTARSRLDLDLALAGRFDDIATTTTLCEQFLREHVVGQHQSLPITHRARAVRRYGRVAQHLANRLKANREVVASKFWSLQAERWAAEAADIVALGYVPFEGEETDQSRLRVHVDVRVEAYLEYVGQDAPVDATQKRSKRTERERARQRGRDKRRRRSQQARLTAGQLPPDLPSAVLNPHEVAEADSVGPESSGDMAGEVTLNLINRFSKVEQLIERESVGEMITTLTSVTQSYRISFDDELVQVIEQALERLTDWRPVLFADVESVTRAAAVAAEVITRCVRFAAVLAHRYASYRLAPALLLLSRRPELSIDERLEHVERAQTVARTHGQILQEVRCIRQEALLTTLAERAVDAERLLRDLEDILYRSIEMGVQAGVSSLADRVAELSKLLSDLAIWLVPLSPEASFRIMAMTQGWMGRALTDEPLLVGEFESAVMVRAHVDTSAASRRHYGDVVRRICRVSQRDTSQTGSRGITSLNDEDTDSTRAGDARLRFVASDKEVWVFGQVGCGPDGRNVYFARPLPTSPQSLRELVDGVWFHVRDEVPDRLNALLAELFDVAVSPWWEDVDTAQQLIIGFQDSLPFLPLHGARGPTGVVGAVYAVNYAFSAARDVSDRHADRPAAAVLGWDPRTMSDVESREISAILGNLFDVPIYDDPAAATEAIVLNHRRNLTVLHLAGHGHLEQFPRSLESTVELMPDVTVSASEWLLSGCAAHFVFFNVCEVGLQETVSGDAFGFPLAARVRGSGAFLAPTTYVTPQHARQYARLFYEAARDHDAANAVFVVTQFLVKAGAPASAWLPYALHGNVARLTSLAVAETS